MESKKVAYPVGLTVKEVRLLTVEEMDAEGWEDSYHHPCVAIIFNDGSMIYPSCDYEGNGPGAIFGMSNGDALVVEPLKNLAN